MLCIYFQLVEGIYTLMLTVYDDVGNYGKTEVNITVLPGRIRLCVCLFVCL